MLAQAVTFQTCSKEANIEVVPVLNQLSTTPWRSKGVWMNGPTFFWPRHEMEVSVQFYPRKKSIVPMEKRLAGLRKWKFLTLPRLELSPLGRPALVSRYTDCTTAGLRFRDDISAGKPTNLNKVFVDFFSPSWQMMGCFLNQATTASFCDYLIPSSPIILALDVISSMLLTPLITRKQSNKLVDLNVFWKLSKSPRALAVIAHGLVNIRPK
jgi:hypothetical protein